MENLDLFNQEAMVEEKLQKVDEETLSHNFKFSLSVTVSSASVFIIENLISSKLELISNDCVIMLEVMNSYFLSVFSQF